MEHAFFADDRIQPRRFAQALVVVALVVPMLGLIGWLRGIPLLASYGGQFIPMAPSTAIGFCLLTSALLIAFRPGAGTGARAGAGLAGGLVAAYGALVFLAWLTGWPLSPDESLFTASGTLEGHRTGLMSPATGALLLLVGLSLAALVRGHSAGTRANFWLSLAAAGAGAAAFLGIQFVLGYGLGNPLFYEGTTIPMALPTALSFVLLGGGLALMAVLHRPAPGRWFRTLSNVPIGSQLRLGLGAVLVLVFTLGVLTWVQTDKLWLQTRNLYDYPLAVRRAIGGLNVDVLHMRIGMRGLPTAKNELAIQATLQHVDLLDADAHRQIDILYERYLGNREDIDNIFNAVVNFKTIRTETIRLLRAGKTAEVIERLNPDGIAGLHVTKTLDYIKVVDDVARKHGDEFYASATVQNAAINRQLAVFVAVILLLTLIIAWLLVKGFKDPLDDLTTATRRFREGQLDSRSSYASSNEFGTLAASFNAMADALQMQIQVGENAARLADVMLRDDELPGFCRELLKALLEHTGSQVAAVYLLNEEQTAFEHFDSIGLGADARATFSATALEGELGAAVATRRISRLSDIPADSRFAFGAVSGEFQPREILTIPLVFEHQVVAVISLASVRAYATPALRLVDDIWVTLTARVNGVLAFRKINALAQRLEHQNRELDAQKHALSAQADALLERNAELAVQKRQVDEASRLKSAFLSKMSHELRTPLNSVIALSGVLGRRLADKIPADEYGYLEVIERNGRNLLALINDILDLSRIEAGREELSVSRFALRDLAGELVAMLEAQAQEKGIALLNQVPADLPPMTSDLVKCRHILQNLVGNAVKFTERGQVSITAEVVQAGGRPSEIRIAVTDTGIGIAAEALAYIFEEFRQADDSTSRQYGGTGLGLSIAQKYAHFLGGDINAVSVPGQGSTFTVWLPLVLSRPEDAPAQAAAPTPAAAPSGRRRLSRPGKPWVLVVEDNPDSMRTAKALLGDDYQVIEATDGRAGVEQARAHQPDIILMDIGLPVMDGLQALEEIRADERLRPTPVLAVTASAMKGDRESILAHDFDGYLSKPIDRDELMRVLQQLLAPKHE